MVRHVCFFIMPVAGNDVWRHCADSLIARLPLFDGRRRVAIATGPNLDPPELVEQYLAGREIEFVHVENNPALREGVAWEPLVAPIEKDASGSAIFWGHAKGVTHPDSTTVRRWTDLLFRGNLDHWPRVESLLSRFPVAGMFKRDALPALDWRPEKAGFEYSGGFFWVRAEDLFRRDWRSIDRNPWGTESAPGAIFTVHEGGMIFPDRPIGKTVEETELYREADIRSAERDFDSVSANWPFSHGVLSSHRGAFPPVATRHLAYVVLPVAGNGIWQKNLEQIAKRIHLFNGRKRIAVLTPGPGDRFRLDTPEEVRRFAEACGIRDVEWFQKPNNHHRREGEVWEDLLDPLKTDSPSEAIFFGHAKGVTRDPGNPAHRWASLLYRVSLENWHRVDHLLSRFPIVGGMKHVGANHHRTPSKWQYLGAFYWLRSAEFFRRDWRRLDPTWAGVETMPGLHYSVAEGGRIFPDRDVSDVGIYTHAFWDAIERELSATTTAPALSLAELLATGRYSPDKNSTHSYGPFYDSEFMRFRDSAIRLLEVGVQTGGSLCLWRDYFPRAEIIGVDVNLQHVRSDVSLERITLHRANAYDQAFAARIPELDIAIDDGPHSLQSQIRFVELYLPRVRPGGLLIVEDVQHYQHFEDLKRCVPESRRHRVRFIDLRKVKGRWDDLLFVVDC